VFYSYSLTVQQAEWLFGDGNVIGGGGLKDPSSMSGTIGCLKNAVVFTDQFDTSQNWLAAGILPTTGANGKITIGGSGASIPGQIVQAPTTLYPFLGIEFNAN
jgi:hypothetical protein